MRDGWAETTLGQYIDINTGKLDVNAASEFGEYPFFTCSRETYRINEAAFEGESVLVAGNGDLNVKYYDGEFNAYQRTYVLNSIDKKILDNRFLFLYMQTYIGYLRSETRGTVIQYLKKGQFADAKIKLPPLPEQKRIVDLISSVDSYIKALEQQLESAKKSRDAVLHELLTAGGDGRIRAGLSEICTMIKRGQAPSYTEQKSVTVLNQKCVRNGRIQFEFARQTDSNIKPINEWAYLRAEDTLVNSTGVGTLGRVAFVGIQDEPLTVDSHLTIVRPDINKIQPSFLGLSLHFREADIEGLAAGSSGQTELSREALGNLIITIPPPQEQKRIVEIISAMDTMVNQTQLAITEAQNLRSGLLSDLLSGTHEIPLSYDKVMGAA